MFICKKDSTDYKIYVNYTKLDHLRLTKRMNSIGSPNHNHYKTMLEKNCFNLNKESAVVVWQKCDI